MCVFVRCSSRFTTIMQMLILYLGEEYLKFEEQAK